MQLCPGGYMPTLAEIYEQHAEECLRAAAKTENPKYRDMLLTRKDVASASGSIEARCGRRAQWSTCTDPCGVIS